MLGAKFEWYTGRKVRGAKYGSAKYRGAKCGGTKFVNS